MRRKAEQEAEQIRKQAEEERQQARAAAEKALLRSMSGVARRRRWQERQDLDAAKWRPTRKPETSKPAEPRPSVDMTAADGEKAKVETDKPVEPNASSDGGSRRQRGANGGSCGDVGAPGVPVGGPPAAPADVEEPNAASGN